MKKVILLTLMLVVAMTADAQIEVMTKNVFPPDPMTNSEGYTSWTSEHVQIVERNDGIVRIRINNPPHVFADKYRSRVKVGLYDNKGNLVEMSERWYSRISDDGTKMWLMFGFTKDSTVTEFTDTIPIGEAKGRQMLEYNQYNMARIGGYIRINRASHVAKFLKEGRGYVRITTPTWGGTLFDVSARIKRNSGRKK